MTSKFQEAVVDAQKIAKDQENQYIEPFHVMSALLKEKDETGSIVKSLLLKTNANIALLQQKLSEELVKLPRVSGVSGGKYLSNDLELIFDKAEKLATQYQDSYISSELFVLAALQQGGNLSKILKACGVTEATLQKAIQDIRGGERVEHPESEQNRQALEKYTIDLTIRAEQGKLDPVIGRDDEIRRVIQVLQRRTKK